MPRTRAHFQDREPFLEKILSNLRLRKIIKHIPKNSRVLDLGCGYNGGLLNKVSRRISSGIGIDLSIDPNFSNKKIKLLAHNLNKALPFSDGEFNIVASLANLEHLEKPIKSIIEIYRVLEPGGALLLTTPSIYNKPILEFLAFKLHLISGDEIRDHKQYYSRKSIRKVLIGAGFKEEDINIKYFQCGLNIFVKAKKC